MLALTDVVTAVPGSHVRSRQVPRVSQVEERGSHSGSLSVPTPSAIRLM